MIIIKLELIEFQKKVMYKVIKINKYNMIFNNNTLMYLT